MRDRLQCHADNLVSIMGSFKISIGKKDMAEYEFYEDLSGIIRRTDWQGLRLQVGMFLF